MERKKLIYELTRDIKEEFKKYNYPIIDKYSEVKLDDKFFNKAKKEFGKNKIIPKEFELHILYALSFYPELKEVKITFRVKPAIFLMETRMNFFSLFSGNRHYVINIKKKFKGFLLKHFSVKGLAGLIGHEIGHVLDYEHKSNIQLAGFAFKYIFPGSRRKIELANDLRTFYHGLGDSMILYEKEYMKSPLHQNFKKYRNSFYLRKEELKLLNKKNN